MCGPESERRMLLFGWLFFCLSSFRAYMLGIVVIIFIVFILNPVYVMYIYIGTEKKSMHAVSTTALAPHLERNDRNDLRGGRGANWTKTGCV